MAGKIADFAARFGTRAKRLLLHALRLGLGGVFLYAGLQKAFAPQEFVQTIQNYALIPSLDLVILLAVYVPWLEIAVGAALIARRLELGALILSTMLLLIFTGALTSGWARGLDISCGCFARDGAKISTHFPELLARDLALLLTAGLLLRLAWRDGRFDKPPTPAKKS